MFWKMLKSMFCRQLCKKRWQQNVDDYIPSNQHPADKKEEERPPPLIPTHAPIQAKQVDHQSQQQGQQQPKQQKTLPKKSGGLAKSRIGKEAKLKTGKPIKERLIGKKTSQRQKFSRSMQVYGNLKELAHNPNFIKNYKSPQQQQQVNNVGWIVMMT